MENVYHLVSRTVTTKHLRKRTACHKREPANFLEVGYVLLAREHFNNGEKLCLCWRDLEGFRIILATLGLAGILRNTVLETGQESRSSFTQKILWIMTPLCQMFSESRLGCQSHVF